MRIGIQGWGSEGDLRPLVALAGRARRAGHDVRLVLTPIDERDYAPLCRSLEVPLRVVPEGLSVSIQQLARSADSADPSALSRAVLELGFYPLLDAMYDAAVELCASSDVVVGHMTSWYVKVAAAQAGVPFAAVHYYPRMVPTRHAPPPLLPAWPWLARPGWALLSALLNLAFRKPAAEFLARRGLPPVRDALPDLMLSQQLNLLAASPAFCPPAPDWGERSPVCGEFVVPEAEEPWAPSPELAAFLADGPPPVLLSLGSMEHMAPERAHELLLAGARQSGVRSLVQTKREHPEGRDGDVFRLRWAPHRHLLPRCAAMVHHGGAGTTHAALRAGLPSAVLPFIPEQRLWAAQLQKAGAGAAPLSFWKATPERLAERIREVAGSAPLRARASALASAMAGEDGTGEAVRRLERLAARS